ncbi:MAG: hypothetical protein JO182_27330 [Acidobacteriaceae bacterium]|nr:hypothetical protein [Acidobacteriaceae bacterium]
MAYRKTMLTVLTGYAICCVAQDTATVQFKVVKGAPFSAQAVTESTQVLTDGNRVTHKTSATITRDSEGRTRREQSLANGTSVIFIQDPVAGVSYVVDPKARSVRKVAISTADSKSIEAAIISGESLGAQVIEGFQAEGTRVTHTIAAGGAGNDRPLDITIEAWYSSELQTIVMRKTIDPRTGETVFRLTSIQRSEPDRSLFEIPADYMVRDVALNRFPNH